MISCQLQMTGSSFQAFGGNEYKCEFPVVQLSFLFSLEPPFLSSYQSGTVLPFIMETEVKGLYWNCDQVLSICLLQDHRTYTMVSYLKNKKTKNKN